MDGKARAFVLVVESERAGQVERKAAQLQGDALQAKEEDEDEDAGGAAAEALQRAIKARSGGGEGEQVGKAAVAGGFDDFAVFLDVCQVNVHAVLLAARTGKGGNAYQAQQCPEAQGDGNSGEQAGFKGEGDLSFSHEATGCGGRVARSQRAWTAMSSGLSWPS